MGLIGTADERPAATPRRRHGRSAHRRRCHGDVHKEIQTKYTSTLDVWISSSPLRRLLPYVAVRTPELGGRSPAVT
ncbi:unnamed protein product [Arctogadus glacialis]